MQHAGQRTISTACRVHVVRQTGTMRTRRDLAVLTPPQVRTLSKLHKPRRDLAMLAPERSQVNALAKPNTHAS